MLKLSSFQNLFQKQAQGKSLSLNDQLCFGSAVTVLVRVSEMKLNSSFSVSDLAAIQLVLQIFTTELTEKNILCIY